MQGTSSIPRDPKEALERCIRAFVGPEETLPQNLDELKGRYDNVLRGKRALIVLDSAADGKQVRPLLPPAGCALVVTSIDTISLPGVRCRISLDEFTADESRELLLKIVPDLDKKVADRICYLCGYLPLAVRAAGCFLDESRIDPENYAKQLDDERTRLEYIDPEGVGDISVEAAFNLSYKRLSGEAAGVFRKLAIFQSSFDSAAEEYVCEDPNQWHLSSMEKRSLVLSAIISDKTKRYRLQHLGRLFAKRQLQADEHYVAGKRLAQHYGELLTTASKLYNKGGECIRQALILFDKERDNIRTGQKWAESNCEEDEDAAGLCILYSVGGECLFDLRGLPRERLPSLEISLCCARRLGKTDAVCTLLGSIGRAHVELGDFQGAIKQYEQQLSLVRKLGMRPEEGRVLNSMGSAYQRIEPARAITLYEQALAVSQETHDRQNEGRALNNLGDAYRDFGQFNRAIDFYKRQLEIAQESGDLRSEGNALNSMGDAYNNLGETKRAIEYHEKSLKIAQEIGTNLGKLNILNNLGNAYLAVGQPRRAVEFYEQSRAMSREIGYSFGEHMTVCNLGEAYIELGDPRRAIDFLEGALKAFRENGSRRGEGNVLNNLGKAYHELGDEYRAVEFQEKALAIARALGSTHGEGHVLNDLGEAYDALGEVPRATALYQQAMSIFTEIGDLRGVGLTLNNLGRLSTKSAEIRPPRDLGNQAHENSSQVANRRTQDQALDNSGKAGSELKAAIDLLEQAITIARQISNSSAEADALFNMSLALDKMDDRAQAISLTERALNIYEQVESRKISRVRDQLTQWKK
jgi:tetratricopeptide (TPR) repeat protein